MTVILMMNCFCGMVDQRKAFSLISSWDHCQRSSPSRIADTLWAGFERVQNLSSGLVEWSCAVVVTTMTDLKGAATFKMKPVVIIVFKDWQLWTILTESSILDLASRVPQNGAFWTYEKQFENSFVFGWMFSRKFSTIYFLWTKIGLRSGCSGLSMYTNF